MPLPLGGEEVASYTFPVLPDLQYAAIRFENFVSEILLPAAFPDRVPLEIGVWQTPDRTTPDVAFGQAFRPVELGWRWRAC